MSASATSFTLAGFSEKLGSRVYRFEGVSPDRSRVQFTVSADLALCRRYGIRIQELPLLCRVVLEAHDGASPERAYVYSENSMRAHAEAVAAREAAHKRPRPPQVAKGENAPPRV